VEGSAIMELVRWDSIEKHLLLHSMSAIEPKPRDPILEAPCD
jgi:hypothetical protein